MSKKMNLLVMVSMFLTYGCYAESIQSLRTESGVIQKSSMANKTRRGTRIKPANKELALIRSEMKMVSAEEVAAKNFDARYVAVRKFSTMFYHKGEHYFRSLVDFRTVSDTPDVNKYLSFADKNSVNSLIKNNKTEYLKKATDKCVIHAKEWIMDGKKPKYIELVVINYEIDLTPYKDNLIMIEESSARIACGYFLE